MENSRAFLEQRIALISTVATIIGALGIGLGLGAIVLGIYLWQNNAIILGLGPQAFVLAGFAIGIVIMVAAVNAALAALTQVATLQTFVNIERNTEAMLKELRRQP